MANKVLFEIEIDTKAQDLVKLQTEMDRLNKQQKELGKTGRKNTVAYQRNKVVLKELGSQHRALSKQVSVSSKNTKALGNSYNDLTERNRRLSQELRRLNDPLGKNKKRFDQISKSINTNTQRLKNMDAQMGRSFRNVGNYGSALKGLGGSFVGAAAGAAGFVGGAQLVFSGIKDAISKVREFQQGNANLASVLGKTRKEIVALSEDAKRLGASTAFSASEVTQLQTEFAKLGFNENEILSATEATLNLAAATGTELGEAAAVAGATLGGFGLEADQTQRLTDVMAKAFSSSALDMNKFSEAMKSAAPAAAAVGVSVEDTTAMLGTLANAGISGSKAGNALKNVFINLNKEGITLEEAFEQVNSSTDKLGTAVGLVKKEAAPAFLALAKGSKDSAELADKLRDAGGAAKAMADEQLNTLDGAIKILSSSWEGFILSLADGEGKLSEISQIVINDLSVGLSVMSGNVDAAGDKFSYFSLLLTGVKNGFTQLISLVKILTLPWQVFFGLVKEAAEQFGFVSDSAISFKETMLGIQNVLLRMPQIMTIVTDEIVQMVNRIVDVFGGLGQALRGLLSRDVKQFQLGMKRAAGAIANGFNDITEDIPKKIAALFDPNNPDNKKAKEDAEKKGKEDGNSYAKGFSDALEKEFKKKKKDGFFNVELSVSLKQFKEAQAKIEAERQKMLKSRIADIPQEEQQKIDAALQKKREFDKKEEQKIIERREAIRDGSIEAAQITADAVFQIQQQNLERRKQYEIDQLTIQDERAQDLLQGQLDSGLISQAEYENNRAALAEETALKREEIERTAFEKQKRLSTAQALINGALAITKILAETPKVDFGVATAIQIGLATATTAAQIATIQSQKFAKGGLLEGASHEAGGIPAIVDGSRPVELEGGEAVINKRSVAMFKDELSAMNMAGGGVPLFKSGGYVPKYANGGLVRGVGTQSQDLKGIADEIRKGVTSTLKVVNDPRETAGELDNVLGIENEFTI